MEGTIDRDDIVVIWKTPVHVVVKGLSELVADGCPRAALIIGEYLMKRHTGGLICSEPFWFWMARAAEDLKRPCAATYWRRADQCNQRWVSRKNPLAV